MTVKMQSSAELLDRDRYPDREFMLIGGKDGVGKSCACVSIAWWVSQCKPAATCYVLDTENKFRSALRSFGADAPRNIQLYGTSEMNQVTATMSLIMKQHKPGDWLFVESLGPVWDQAQDLAYLSIAGVAKAEYLDAKPGTRMPTGVERKGSPIPNPDNFWQIAKGAYDGAFLDPMRHSTTMNVVLTSIAKPIKEMQPGRKENADRKALRIETGMDMNLCGSPTTPSVVETLILLELNQGSVTARVLRDNLVAPEKETGRTEFAVPGRRDFGMTFWSECRGGEIRL